MSRELHRVPLDFDHQADIPERCLGCGHPHPCPTRRAITCQGDQKS